MLSLQKGSLALEIFGGGNMNYKWDHMGISTNMY